MNADTANADSKVVDDDGVEWDAALMDLAISSSFDALCGVARVDHGVVLCLGGIVF
jgi:hypothetical protein